VSDLAGDEVSQQAVGYWETGKADLRKVHPRRLEAYASVLHISLAELAEAVEYKFQDLFPDLDFEAVAPRATQPSESNDEIIHNLQAFIDEYSSKFKELLEPRWQRWLAQTDFWEEPETPEDWPTTFLYFREKVNPR